MELISQKYQVRKAGSIDNFRRHPSVYKFMEAGPLSSVKNFSRMIFCTLNARRVRSMIFQQLPLYRQLHTDNLNSFTHDK